jgi:GNAT superfamily N-acetyltransferase
MAIEIVDFDQTLIESAASLVSRRYRDLLSMVPVLPAVYAETSVLSGLLAEIARTGAGAAAIRNGELVGFIAAWSLPSILGRPGAYSPEWANATSGADGRRVMEALYTVLAPRWRKLGCHSHWISLMADDTAGLDWWDWLGFGMVAVDAVRGREPLAQSRHPARVRMAGSEDLEAVIRLDESLVRHLSGPPTYLRDDGHPSREDYRGWLAGEDVAVWIAEEVDDPIAFLTIGPAVQGACTIIRDEGTASIISAFTEETRRGSGVASTLLTRAISWARDRGYVRIAVDFEPMNPWARRFWLHYFKPVVFTVVRHLEALEGDGCGG